MLAIRRAFRVRIQRVVIRSYSTRSPQQSVETDELGLPKEPTWSVRELITSYPHAPLSSDKLRHLHKLAALEPPEEGSQEWNKLTDEMAELTRLVDAVKLIDTTGVEPLNMLEPIVLSNPTSDEPIVALNNDEPHGTALLQYAEHTNNGYYVVNTPSTRRR